MSVNLIDVNPNPLSISLAENTDNHNIITLSNKTNSYIIFKTFINLKSILIAKPSTYFINPNSTNSIEISCIKKDLLLQEYKNIKLLILAYKNNEKVESEEEAKEFFFKKKESGEEKQDVIVTINLENSENLENVENLNLNEEKFINLKSDLIKNNQLIIKSLEEFKNKLKNKLEDQKIIQKGKNKIASIFKSGKFDNVIIITVFIFGLIIGGNLAQGFNSYFK